MSPNINNQEKYKIRKPSYFNSKNFYFFKIEKEDTIVLTRVINKNDKWLFSHDNKNYLATKVPCHIIGEKYRQYYEKFSSRN